MTTLPIMAYSKACKEHMPRMRMLNESHVQGVWDVALVRLSDAQASIQAVEAEIAGLREDAKRLDHLQNRGATVEILPDGSWWKFRIGGLYAAQSPNIRAAIDAAMATGGEGS